MIYKNKEFRVVYNMCAESTMSQKDKRFLQNLETSPGALQILVVTS